MERPTLGWTKYFVFPVICLMTLVIGASLSVANDDSTKALGREASKDNGSATASSPSELPEVDPAEVPDGDEETLLNYITSLRKLKVEGATPSEKRERIMAIQRGILAASDKILALPDLSEKSRKEATLVKWRTLGVLRNSGDAKYAEAQKKMAMELADGSDEKLAEQARMSLLMGRVSALYQGEGEDPKKLAEDVLALLKKSPDSGIQVASTVARMFEITGNLEEAKSLYLAISEVVENLNNEQAAKNAKRAAEMGLARIDLLGKSPVIEGTVFGRDALDWNQYKGKVVLIDFWATWCGPCIAELPNVKKAYEKYHDKGFEIIGISLDTDKSALEKFLDKENLPWVTIFEDDKAQQGFDGAPHVKEFGVNGIPATYLLDRDGKIISISARGHRLEQQLEKLLGSGE